MSRAECAAATTASRRWIPCLSCWLAEKFGKPYPKAHTGIGPHCPRWPYVSERIDFAVSANAALATRPQSSVDSAYRGKEARQRANAPGRDTEGDASMPDKTTTRFKRIQAGQYATEDGRYLIEQQEIERECDCLACQSGSPDCPHDGIALDWFWHIWDTETNDYAEGTHFSSFETLREAKEWFV